MKEIKALLEEALKRNDADSRAFMTGDKIYKEQWILGMFSELFNQKCSPEEQFTYAIKYDERISRSSGQISVFIITKNNGLLILKLQRL